MKIEYFKCVLTIIILFNKNDMKNRLKGKWKRKGTNAKKQIAYPEMIIPKNENVNRAEIKIVIDEEEKSTARKNYYNIIVPKMLLKSF